MNKILIELTCEGEEGDLHSEVHINGVTSVRIASYFYSILEELNEIDTDALKLAIGAFVDVKAEEEG